MLSKGTQKVFSQCFKNHQTMFAKNAWSLHNFRQFGSDSKQMEVDTSIDYYKVLGVQFGASDDQIKKNFYDLAKKFHPDSSKNMTETMRINNEEQFKRIASAYSILADHSKRQRYDEVFVVKLSKKGGGVSSANDLNGFKAKQTWTYTYDSQGNKRKNYTY